MKKITVLIIFILIALAVIIPAAAAGKGFGNGNGLNHNLTFPEPTDYNLTETEIEDLLFMREEEQMAHDLYTVWSDRYSLPIFANIAQAEETHASEISYLMDRYQIQSGRIGNLSTGFGNPVIQALSDSLAEQGNLSLTDALKAGVMIEEQDISDLNKALANTTREDLKVVYENLRRGSENHLRAFSKQLS